MKLVSLDTDTSHWHAEDISADEIYYPRGNFVPAVRERVERVWRWGYPFGHLTRHGVSAIARTEERGRDMILRYMREYWKQEDRIAGVIPGHCELCGQKLP